MEGEVPHGGRDGLRCPVCGAKQGNRLIGAASFTCRRCKTTFVLHQAGTAVFYVDGRRITVTAAVSEDDERA